MDNKISLKYYKKALGALFFAIALTLAYAPTAFAGGIPISSSELQAKIGAGERLIIVDVREPELYRRGHIAGAYNIPYDGAHNRVAKELYSKDTIVFVCHEGPMGDELSDILNNKGFDKVYNLTGGMRAWDGPLHK